MSSSGSNRWRSSCPPGIHWPELEAVPVRGLEGLEIDGLPPHSDAPEWTDLVVQFFALRGRIRHHRICRPSDSRSRAYHLVRQGVPILASADHVEVPGGVLRPLVDPIPLYAWSMAWRRDADGEGISAIRDAAAELATREDWLHEGVGGDRQTWLPEPDASRLANDDFRLVTA